MVVYVLDSLGYSGHWLQQPVIPPLSGEGCFRCSVKPASRGALHLRTQETQVFTQVPWVNSQLGAGRPTFCNQGPTQISHSDIPPS